MFMTEIRGGSDLASSEMQPPARRTARWYLSGAKWFCSNVDAQAIATLARPEGAEPGLRGLALFLVPAERSDGTPNGIRIKRLKDKLGTRSVPTAEMDFVDAEAYLRLEQPEVRRRLRVARPEPHDEHGERLPPRRGHDGPGHHAPRLPGMPPSTPRTAGLRQAARRAADGARDAREHGRRDRGGVLLCLLRGVVAGQRHRATSAAAACTASSSPLAKFRGARWGLELASQAVEIYGGNGYIENWPAARQLRDAQCHTIWEGAENIICLDILRAMAKEQAHDALLDRVDKALSGTSHPALGSVKDVIAQARRDAQEIILFLARADNDVRQLHARRVTAWLADLMQAALLLEQAEDELKRTGNARKAAVVRFFVRGRLHQSPMLRHRRGPLGTGPLRGGDPLRAAGRGSAARRGVTGIR